jgi:hypothetical protein
MLPLLPLSNTIPIYFSSLQNHPSLRHGFSLKLSVSPGQNCVDSETVGEVEQPVVTKVSSGPRSIETPTFVHRRGPLSPHLALADSEPKIIR